MRLKSNGLGGVGGGFRRGGAASWLAALLVLGGCGGDDAPAGGSTPSAGGSAGAAGKGGSGGSSAGAGGSAGAAGSGAGAGGSAGSSAGSGGKSGSAGSASECSAAGDCKLPDTINPKGCAEAACEEGKCVFRAKDKDGDGKRSKLCKDTAGEVTVETGNDCDDNDPKRFPGAWDGPEGEGNAAACDGVDNDCSGTPDDNVLSDGTSCACKPGAVGQCSEDSSGKPILWPLNEPKGACKYGSKTCVADAVTGIGKWGPCTDAIAPVVESCNKVDDDCDDQVDEPDDASAPTWLYDGDGDGHGAVAPGTGTPFASVRSCFNPGTTPAECTADYCGAKSIDECCPKANWKTNISPDDCDDRDLKINPDASEVCNGIDDNCRDGVDEVKAIEGAPLWIYDGDNDGHGATDPATQLPFGKIVACDKPTSSPPECTADYCGSKPIDECCPPANWKTGITSGDCDDREPKANPDSPEKCGDNIDNNCDGAVDDALAVDAKLFYYDGDGDGVGDATIAPVRGCVTPTTPPATCAKPPCKATSWKSAIVGNDCNDGDPTIAPTKVEKCDGAKVDENCNGASNEGCACNSNDPPTPCGSLKECNYNPKGTTCQDGQLKSTCPPKPALVVYCKDADGDKYCDLASCEEFCPPGTPSDVGITPPAGYTTKDSCLNGFGGATDCDDKNKNINPGADEVCDGVNNNCANGIDEGDPGGGVSCDVPGKLGPCQKGIRHCVQGALVCQQQVTEQTETCNGQDDDCDGTVDDGPPGSAVFPTPDKKGIGGPDYPGAACWLGIPFLVAGHEPDQISDPNSSSHYLINFSQAPGDWTTVYISDLGNGSQDADFTEFNGQPALYGAVLFEPYGQVGFGDVGVRAALKVGALEIVGGGSTSGSGERYLFWKTPRPVKQVITPSVTGTINIAKASGLKALLSNSSSTGAQTNNVLQWGAPNQPYGNLFYDYDMNRGGAANVTYSAGSDGAPKGATVTFSPAIFTFTSIIVEMFPP